MLISPLGKSSLDIEDIRKQFKDYLKDNDIIKDSDYLGSNISQLIDIMSYGIYNVNATNAILANSTMLPTSEIRQNIVQIAKTLGYHITRRISSKMRVKISNGDIAFGDYITIPKYTRFDVGDYEFITTEDYVLTYIDKSITIDLVEGILVNHEMDSYLYNSIVNDTNNIVLNYQNIEENSIKVYIKKAGKTEFNRITRVNSLTDFSDKEMNYFEEYDSDTGWVKLITHYAGVGSLLHTEDEYKIEFIISSGKEANNLADVELSNDETILDSNDVEVELEIERLTDSRAGAEEESDESIKEYAPLFYNTGNRVTTEIDYESFLIRNSEIETAGAWGGETMPQHKKGRIYFSAIPSDTNQKYFDNQSVASFLDMLYKYRIVSTERVYWQPVYIYLDINIDILGTVIDLKQKQKQIDTLLNTLYIDNELNKFKAYLYYSKIVRSIESVFDNDKKASVEVTLQPRLRLHLNNFDTLYVMDELDDKAKEDVKKLLVSIPKTPKQYKLVKGLDEILVKDESYVEGKDIQSYMLNGWELVYSNLSDINIQFKGDKITQTDNKLFYDGVEFAEFDEEDGILYVDESFKSVVETLDNHYIDIIMEHDRFVNVKLERNTFITLGDINYF